jgi:hypothetical protein
MTSINSLAFILGASFASGLNLYATVATLGLLHRNGIVHLPPSLEILANPWVVGIASALYFVEFVADKIPYVDSVWDAIHTFIRPPAAALLGYSSVGGVSEEWRLAAALLAGSVALTSHGTKASTRVAVNTSPEPVSNWVLSLGEDGLAISLAWMAAAHPLITLVLVTLLVSISIYVVVKLFGALRRGLSRIFGRPSAPLPHQTP